MGLSSESKTVRLESWSWLSMGNFHVGTSWQFCDHRWGYHMDMMGWACDTWGEAIDVFENVVIVPGIVVRSLGHDRR